MSHSLLEKHSNCRTFKNSVFLNSVVDKVINDEFSLFFIIIIFVFYLALVIWLLPLYFILSNTGGTRLKVPLCPQGVSDSRKNLKKTICEPAKILMIPLIPYLSINNRLGCCKSLSSSHWKPVTFYISAIRGVPEANSTRVPCRKAIRDYRNSLTNQRPRLCFGPWQPYSCGWFPYKPLFPNDLVQVMELENIVANTVYLKARESECRVGFHGE